MGLTYDLEYWYILLCLVQQTTSTFCQEKAPIIPHFPLCAPNQDDFHKPQAWLNRVFLAGWRNPSLCQSLPEWHFSCRWPSQESSRWTPSSTTVQRPGGGAPLQQQLKLAPLGGNIGHGTELTQTGVDHPVPLCGAVFWNVVTVRLGKRSYLAYNAELSTCTLKISCIFLSVFCFWHISYFTDCMPTFEVFW